MKKVQKKKKVIKPPTKKKRVKKAPKIEKPRPLPKKETLETPVKMPEKGDIASKQPDDLKKSAVQKEKTPVSSGPKVVKASPAYATNPRPKYPRVARRRGYEGVVMLKVMVDREGKANEVLVLKSSGHGILDRSAVNAVRKWVFTPGTVNGKRAKMWVQVPVRFELKGR